MALFDPKTFTLLTTFIFLLGGIFAFPSRYINKTMRTRLALIWALLGSLLIAYGAIGFWQKPMSQGEIVISLLELPIKLSFSLFIDRLTAFFLLLTGLLSAGVVLYSFVWLEGKQEQHRIAGVYNLFVLFTALLLVVNNTYFFLVFLECMTLTFGYLTLYQHNKLLEEEGHINPQEMVDAKKAFGIYLIFSHIGVIFITTALSLLALSAGSLNFDALRNLSLEASPVLASSIFLLALAGLGVKGGFAPAHPWVSIVHPQLPAPIHALASGLIIKISSFYMLIRMFFEFLTPTPWWWGWLVLLLAGLTALVGVFYAITSRDLKTALAHHSVENFGIILAGLGLALLLFASTSPSPLASLALVASLYHLLNHAIFKSLLFLCTGAIENRTGTVKLEELGGLIHRFPWTAGTFLVGAVAIAGFPPLNGFISEWLTLQTLFAGLDTLTGGNNLPWLAAGVFMALLMLGAAFGLTALAFVKIAGETLLGVPRRPELLSSERKGDVPWRMRGVLVILAVLCLLLGLFPGLVVDQLALIAQDMLALEQPLEYVETTATSLTLNVPTFENSYTIQLSMLPLLILALVPLTLATIVGVHRQRWKRGPLWTCGTPYRPEAMQITGGAFAFLTWEWAGGQQKIAPSSPHTKEEIDGNSPVNEDPIPWRLPLSETRYVYEYFRMLINAMVKRLTVYSKDFGNWFQGGDIRQYLVYLFVAFMLILIVSVIQG